VLGDYLAHIDPAKVGLNFSSIVFVTLRDGSRDNVRAFEAALVPIPEIIQAERLFGDLDHMLHVVTRGLTVFQQLYDESLPALTYVLRLRSTLVMTSIIQNRPLPIWFKR
jgi:DNA-binding Lrp family transcriptional regulator